MCVMTLPTRAKDGGIDVEKVKIVQNTIFIGEWFLSTDAFIRLISAHTRERCAKMSDRFLCSDTSRDFARGQHSAAFNISDAIRKMED